MLGFLPENFLSLICMQEFGPFHSKAQLDEEYSWKIVWRGSFSEIGFVSCQQYVSSKYPLKCSISVDLFIFLQKEFHGIR